MAELTVDEAGVVAFTQELVRIRSVHDPSAGTAEQPAADLVAARMREFGWDPQITQVAPGRPNVVAVIEGGGGPGRTLMLEGHTDVVTEGDRAAWTFDPYAGDIVDGRLRGRGSADMKAGVAAMIYAARALVEAGPFPGRLVLGALVDEEGLMLGAKDFARTPLAAQIDGAGPFRTFWSVYAPLAMPGLAIVGILAFNYHWNEFFRPLIMTISEQNFTLPLGLVSLQGNLGSGSVATVLAGVVISMIPALVVFVVGQRPLREGLTAGVSK